MSDDNYTTGRYADSCTISFGASGASYSNGTSTQWTVGTACPTGGVAFNLPYLYMPSELYRQQRAAEEYAQQKEEKMALLYDNLTMIINQVRTLRENIAIMKEFGLDPARAEEELKEYEDKLKCTVRETNAARLRELEAEAKELRSREEKQANIAAEIAKLKEKLG